jgi:hypothetical protein
MIGAVSNFSQLPDELTPILLDLSDLSGTDLSGTDELTPILLSWRIGWNLRGQGSPKLINLLTGN